MGTSKFIRRYEPITVYVVRPNKPNSQSTVALARRDQFVEGSGDMTDDFDDLLPTIQQLSGMNNPCLVDSEDSIPISSNKVEDFAKNFEEYIFSKKFREMKRRIGPGDFGLFFILENPDSVLTGEIGDCGIPNVTVNLPNEVKFIWIFWGDRILLFDGNDWEIYDPNY